MIGRLVDGFILKREDMSQKDIHISLIDYAGLDRQRQSKNLDIIAAESLIQYPPDTNIYKFVNQLEIVGAERRIPDGILYINGLPVVVLINRALGGSFGFQSSVSIWLNIIN